MRTAIAPLIGALLLVACAGGAETATTTPPTELVLLTHGSFVVSDSVWETFTAETGITVTVLQGGDAGEILSQAILTKDNPVADVIFGVDTTFLSRAVGAGIFRPYSSPHLEAVPDSLKAGEEVTPIDFGDVCINYDKAFYADGAPPASLSDLIDPAFSGHLVVENPATSSPGLAFLLATVAEFGDGWEDYWRSLVANDVAVTSGWEEAYWGEFTVGGGGDRPLVVSYASSPPAEVIYADPPITEAPTAVMEAGCFRQVEYAGILRSSTSAEALIDFMLGATFQEDIPLNMFVFPANSEAALPEEFITHTLVPALPLSMDPEEIELHRQEWIDRWTEIVLGG